MLINSVPNLFILVERIRILAARNIHHDCPLQVEGCYCTCSWSASNLWAEPTTPPLIFVSSLCVCCYFRLDVADKIYLLIHVVVSPDPRTGVKGFNKASRIEPDVLCSTSSGVKKHWNPINGVCSRSGALRFEYLYPSSMAEEYECASLPCRYLDGLLDRGALQPCLVEL